MHVTCSRALPLALAVILASPSVQAQDAVWAVRLGGTANDNSGLDVARVPASGGDFYAAGQVDAFGSFVFGLGTANEISLPVVGSPRGEAFIARYDVDGVPLWARIARGPAKDRTRALAVWSDGDVIGVGNYNDFVQSVPASPLVVDGGSNADVTIGAGGSGLFMARYDAVGDLEFARRLMQTGSLGSHAYDVATLESADSDDFIVVGAFRGGTFGDEFDPSPIDMPLGGTVGFLSSDGFVARYRANGDILWVERIGGAAADNISSVAVLPGGDLILVGELGRRDIAPTVFFPGTTAETLLPVHPTLVESKFVLRLDISTFEVRWLHTFGLEGLLSGQQRVEVGPQGGVYVAGTMPTSVPDTSGNRPPSTFDGSPLLPGAVGQAYVMRLDPVDGQPIWKAGTRDGNSSGNVDIAPTSDGVLFVQNGGTSVKIIDESGTELATLAGAVRAKWSRDGAFEWARTDQFSVTAIESIDGGCAISTGRAPTGFRVDLGAPTEIFLGRPWYGTVLAKFDVAPSTLVTLPPDLVQPCDESSTLATVHFIVEVEGATSGSILQVIDSASGTLVASVLDPSGQVGVGPLQLPIGVSNFVVSLIDPAGTVVFEDELSVTIQDDQPPVLIGCGAATLECEGEETVLTYSTLGISVTDDCDAAPAIVFDPPAVPMGSTMVVAIARDATGNESQCSFTVDVLDTRAPVFVLVPEDLQRECTANGGAYVSFEILAEDACGVAAIECVDQNARVLDPLQTFFAVGVHTITCTASDPSGNMDSVSFQLEVTNGSAPVIVDPGDLSLSTTPGGCTAVATFEVTATSLCDPAVAIECRAPWGLVQSGDEFPLGTTLVVCTASDLSGNLAEASFRVTVVDNEPPVFGGSVGSSVIRSTDCTGTPLALTALDLGLEATDNCDPAVEIECDPATVPPGVHSVLCTARDSAGNEASATLTVEVLRGPFQCTLLRPLDPNVDNEIRAGRVVPLKLRLRCGNACVTDAVVTVDAIEALSSVGTPISNEQVDDPGSSHDNGNEFRLTGNKYQFLLQTTSWNPAAGIRHRIVIRIEKPGHADTLCEVFTVNR